VGLQPSRELHDRAGRGPYTVTINDQHGMSAAWISEPYAGVARQVLPWSAGVVVALLAIALCLTIAGRRWRLMRRMYSASASRPWL
jgi:hypothetical protein